MSVLYSVVVFLGVTCLCAHAQMGGTCGGMNLMQLRAMISRAIENARSALNSQKQLNEYFSRTGFDEAMNPTPYMAKTYHQHYAAFSHLNAPAAIQVDSGYIVQHATRQIAQMLMMSPEQLYACPGLRELWQELISPYCIRRDAICDATARYRSIDGSCNNLNNPVWGRSNRPHRRLLKPVYKDDIGEPRKTGVTGEPLPGARTVSNVVHNQDPCCPVKERDLSLYVMQWGQMVDHDLTDTAIAKGAHDATIICCNLTSQVLQSRSECFPIPIAPGDSRFKEPCMNFVRSIAGHSDSCEIGRRDQLNQATSFLDASFLYGHNDEDAGKIRSFQGGKLRMTRDKLFPAGLEDQTHCELQNQGDYCMKSGDFRIHVMPGLTAQQVMFLREHNRLAEALAMMNPTWCDEDIYQEARKIVIAEYQHITYSQWLPHVIGEHLTFQMGLSPTPAGHSTAYRPDIDPSVSNVFGAVAFRFGHTLLQNTVLFMKNQGMHVRNEMAFNRPAMIFSDQAMGCSFVGMGLSLHPSSRADEQVVDSVRNNLFLDMNGRSFDLISLNIQRGRDHGIAGYNAWRQFCGLPYAIHFGTGPGGLVNHTPKNAQKLFSIYRHPDDIDAFAGGLSETPVEGGVIGPLFSCIVGEQFYNLKYGDRFFYENKDKRTGFSQAQLNSIKTMTMSKLMCLHFHTPHVQMNPFRMPGPMNPMMNCQLFDDLDLSLWKQ
ncbi:peroxidase-like [Mya arenaria]|uniref:peroxidase-like n=1 Tax=Mya arenaria TaxID=6604 RepID=UPI0022E065C2|nr:peroxidase-like [Mya arenaria]